MKSKIVQTRKIISNFDKNKKTYISFSVIDRTLNKLLERVKTTNKIHIDVSK